MDDFREEEIDLRDYWRVLMKRRWTIISFFTIMFLTVAIFTFTATPIYEATSRIVIEKENPNLVSIQEVMAVDATGESGTIVSLPQLDAIINMGTPFVKMTLPPVERIIGGI